MSDLEQNQDEGRVLVTVVIFTISLIGSVVNFIVACFTRTLKTMNNPFGRLAASQACGEFFICFSFTIFVSPMIFFDIEWLKRYHRIVGWINFMCYDVCIWSHLFISLNRMIAICFPFHYDRIFSQRNTRILAFTAWLIPFATAVFMYELFINNGCDFFFTDMFWAFVFTNNEICLYISWYLDFCKDIFIIIIIACFDLVTVIQLLRTRIVRTKYDTATVSLQIGASSNTLAARRQRDKNFFRQVVFQSSIFVIELLTYFIFAWKFENRYIVWLLTTVAWITIHTIDGLIIFSLNHEYLTLFTLRIPRLTSINSRSSSRTGRNTVGPEIVIT